MSAPPPSRREQAFPSRLRGAAERVVALAAAVPVLALAADLVLRELLGRGFEGAGETALLALVAGVAAGIALAGSGERHLRPRLLDRLAPPALVPRLEALGEAVTAAGALLVALGFAALAAESLALGERRPVPGLPPALGQGLPALGFLALAAVRLARLWGRRVSQARDPGGGE